MYAQNGQTVRFVAGFTASGEAATGLTVTCKVWELRGSGTKSPNDTTGTTATVREIGGGGYESEYTVEADCVPIAVFSTTGTADLKAILTGAFSLANLAIETTAQSILEDTGTTIPATLTSMSVVVSNILRWFTNKRTVTDSEQVLYADDGTTPAYTQTLADDGTTTTRGAAT